MNKHIRVTFGVVGLTLATMACQRTNAEAERRAAEAEKQAQEATITAAKLKSEAEEAAKLKAARTEERTKLQKELDAYDRKGASLKERAAKTVGPARKNADAALEELDKREAAAKTSLGKLTDETTPTWDADKKTAEDAVGAVGKSVDALEHTLMRKK